MAAALFATVLSILAASLLTTRPPPSLFIRTDRIQEVFPVVAALALTAVLFAGPIASAVQTKDALFHVAPITNLKFWRAIVVAPLTEELCFRACMVHLNQHANIDNTTTIFSLPFLFGLAHLHHLREHYIANGRTKEAFHEACLICAFQFVYTTLFGWFATYLVVRTGTVWSAVWAHALCNAFGFPDFSVFVRRRTPANVAVMCVYVLGLVGFFALLGPLTSFSRVE
ncbi:hypothetical protein HDU98_011578 [Podochytrium sp. JEL0797]|nr:hypothetical protein HDU98_011578 [Podochytrium sp. JEL0797]